MELSSINNNKIFSCSNSGSITNQYAVIDQKAISHLQSHKYTCLTSVIEFQRSIYPLKIKIHYMEILWTFIFEIEWTMIFHNVSILWKTSDKSIDSGKIHTNELGKSVVIWKTFPNFVFFKFSFSVCENCTYFIMGDIKTVQPGCFFCLLLVYC